MTACLALAACSSTSTGGDPFMATSATGTEGGQKEKKAAQLAQCAQPIGTVSLIEKEIPALEGTGLTSPTTVMRLMIAIVMACIGCTEPGKDQLFTAGVD